MPRDGRWKLRAHLHGLRQGLARPVLTLRDYTRAARVIYLLVRLIEIALL